MGFMGINWGVCLCGEGMGCDASHGKQRDGEVQDRGGR